IELAAVDGAVVARHRRRARAVLEEEAAAHRPDMGIAPDAQEGERQLVVTRGRRRAHDGVVDRAIEREGVVGIDIELGREISAIEHACGLAAGAIEPSEIAPGKRLLAGWGGGRRHSLARIGRSLTWLALAESAQLADLPF